MKEKFIEKCVVTGKRADTRPAPTTSAQKERGITLIALVITIIVLLILAGVTIAMVVGDNGILTRAKDSKIQTEIGEEKEKISVAFSGLKMGKVADNDDSPVGAQELQDEINGTTVTGTGDLTVKYNDSGRSYLVKQDGTITETDGNGETVGKEPIPTNQSFVGCYADIEGDGKVDGIIYADLAVGGSGQLCVSAYDTDYDGNYTVPTKSNLKAYYISQTGYTEGPFKEKGKDKVISPIGGDTEKNERFYIMKLEDSAPGWNYWYESAYDYFSENEELVTSEEFGEGKSNTEKMISHWNNKDYGEQNITNDMWGQIQEEFKDGWFVPSRDEWAAFGDNFKTDETNYEKYGLYDYYWSSSQEKAQPNNAWTIVCSSDNGTGISRDTLNCWDYALRLSKIF